MRENKTSPQSGGKKKKTGRYILLALLLFLLALIVAVSAFFIHTLGKINRVDPNESRVSPEEAATMNFGEDVDPNEGSDGSEIQWAPDADRILGEDENITNILLIGQDRRPGEGRARSDAMILLSVNKEKKAITMVSFLRDNYVKIPDGYMDNRLNVAYAFGGMSLLDEAMQVNFGIHVDKNVEVDFEAFTKIIDLLGGVDIDLSAEEAEYMSHRNGPQYTEGINHLDGSTALGYARIRYLDSDFGRTGRQRKVLGSIAAQVKTISLTDALSLADELLPYLTTDMTNTDIVKYLTEFLPILANVKEINSLHIPGDNDYYYATIRGMSVVVPDLEACRQVLQDALT